MNTADRDDRAPGEIEALLPWYAAGTLAPEETRRVEAALDRDPELASHLARIHEERDASIRSAEALGLPSSRSAAKFFAALDAEPARAMAANPAVGMLHRAGEWLAALRPQTLALAAGAAMLALVVQGGFITGELMRGGGSYSTASGGDLAAGAYVLVAFQPEARAAQIGTLLQSISGHIVDGPYPGGLFKIRIGAADMPAAERSAMLARLKDAADVVRLATPAQ
ncbi:hypothetical protein G3545_17970 [Starkeya sp. ORNL1]|uniref:zf-HC2 domain-containing protein n=1 Tax=Starkeya sp. ORNL1 TaxID=2709380 RepID=UPI0014637C09|nr:zf-HC2 domain-containing protein [Starkeya sp. ORNL1]QJP15371.1 hypothetical protein G3545_17970 [Starkeya sp. ORNL1]